MTARRRPRATMLLEAFRIYVLLSSSRHLSSVNAGGLNGHPGCTNQHLKKYPSGWPEKLDWGIYWFGKDNVFEKASPGTESNFYDPSKQTLIYIHGWEGSGRGTTDSCFREDAMYYNQGWDQKEVPTVNYLNDWLDKGWNVGFFYWDQFADEPCARDAEAKIWGGKSTEDGLRWHSRGAGKEWQTYTSVKDVAELCVFGVEQIMAGYTGPPTRFAGHSIGSQLAVRCANMLHTRNSPAAPSRIALLDPFFTLPSIGIGCKNFGGGSGDKTKVATDTAELVQTLWENWGVATEMYKSSAFTQNSILGDPNPELESSTAVVLRRPMWCGTLQWSCRHLAAVPLYFGSYASEPPEQVGDLGTKKTAICPVPSASCNLEQIKALVRRQINLQKLNQVQRWRQVDGGSTLTCNDDKFKLEIGSAEHVQLDDASRTVADFPVSTTSIGGSVAFCLPIVGACLAALYGAFVFLQKRQPQPTAEQLDEEDALPGLQPGLYERRVELARSSSNASSQASERRQLLESS